MTVEKNDVDISKLFEWSKEGQIVGKAGKKVKIYMRLLGDADTNRARVMALRRSAEMRSLLKDKNSDEYVAFVPDISKEEPGDIIDGIIMFNMRDITQKAIREVIIPVPKEPSSDATTEELEKYQAEVDAYPTVRATAIRAYMDNKIAERKKELSAYDKDRLIKMYEIAVINEICEQELIRRFKELTVFFGTFSDRKFTTRLFKDFDDFNNLPTEVKSDLLDQYSILEIESEELKK